MFNILTLFSKMFCKDGEFNAVAAIWFQTPEASVRALFHDHAGKLIKFETQTKLDALFIRNAQSALGRPILCDVFSAFVLDVRSKHFKRYLYPRLALRRRLGSLGRPWTLSSQQSSGNAIMKCYSPKKMQTTTTPAGVGRSGEIRTDRSCVPARRNSKSHFVPRGYIDRDYWQHHPRPRSHGHPPYR